MTQSALTAIVAVAAVAVLGVILRRATGTPASGTAMPPPPEPGEEEVEADERDETGGTVAITSDGWAFVPLRDRDRVRLVPPRVPEEPMSAAGGTSAEQLGRGDLVAARVKRGAPDHDPWRLEGLDRDHEYRAWRFETEEAARAAHDLVERCVVRAPRNEDGETVTIADADFDEARRREEEIEAELATMPEDVEPDGDPRREPIG